MAALTDRLDYVLGNKAAGPLEEHFGIRTVNDLLRHYPRKYSDGMTVLGEGEDLEEGEHVTFVDVITKAEAEVDEPAAKAGVSRCHAWHSTAKGDRDLLQREVPQEGIGRGHAPDAVGRSRILQGHNAIDPSGVSCPRVAERQIGRHQIAANNSRTSRATGDELLSVFERDFFPIYPANEKVQSWEIYACVRQVLDVLDPIDDPLPESCSAAAKSDIRRRSSTRDPPRREHGRARARRRPASHLTRR